jgi:hypothetical protein
MEEYLQVWDWLTEAGIVRCNVQWWKKQGTKGIIKTNPEATS